MKGSRFSENKIVHILKEVEAVTFLSFVDTDAMFVARQRQAPPRLGCASQGPNEGGAEHNYYARDIGLILETIVEGGSGRIELIAIKVE